MTSWDVSGLNRLALDLGEVSVLAQPNVLKAVEQSANAVRDGWNGRLYTEGHADRTGGSITKTITEGIEGVAADIGAIRGRGRQAGVVRLLEYGSVHNAPHGYGSAALQEEEPQFEARLGFAVWAALADRGLS